MYNYSNIEIQNKSQAREFFRKNLEKESTFIFENQSRR